MPSFTGNPFSSFYKRILQLGNSGNTGTPTSSTITIQAGDGTPTSLSISDDVLYVIPKTDNTTGTFLVVNTTGNNVLAVDTTNKLVKVGASQVSATTQYAYFGLDFGGVTSSAFTANTHYAIPFRDMGFLSDAAPNMAMGSATSSSFNDTNPASSLTIADTAMTIVKAYWYVMDDITIDAVKWLHGADAATGDTTAAHLMAYTVNIANGSTSGDLSGGTVVADGANLINAGYEQIFYQSMTIQSADVDAGKVILFTFASDSVDSDYSINATVKYHIR